MSKHIIDLLGLKPSEFSAYVSRLELASLSQGIDIRLSHEVKRLLDIQIKKLGLDPADTKPEEYYSALLATYASNDQEFARRMNVKSPQDLADKVATLANKLNRGESSIAVSASGVKKALEACPPKKTLKTLKIRSLKSILRREDPRLLYATALFIEDQKWRKAIGAELHSLPTKYTSWQQIETISLDDNWYKHLSRVKDELGYSFAVAELGVVVVVPVADFRASGYCLYQLISALDLAEHLAVASTPYTREAFMDNYSEAVSNISQSIAPGLKPVHGMSVNWHIVHRYLSGRYGEQNLIDDFSTMPQEILWRSVEEKMADMMPSLKIWVNSNYVAMMSDDGRPVSGHLLDVAKSCLLNKDFSHRLYEHFENSLWNELQLRYLKSEPISRLLMQQLNNNQV